MTFHKDDGNKPRLELVPPRALVDVAQVLTAGARKYTRADEHGVMQDGADNWRKGGEASIPRYLGAALRHVNAYQRGEVDDPETGLPHLAHATCCLLFAAELRNVAPAAEAPAAPAAVLSGDDTCARCEGTGEVVMYGEVVPDTGGQHVAFAAPCPRCGGKGTR